MEKLGKTAKEAFDDKRSECVNAILMLKLPLRIQKDLSFPAKQFASVDKLRDFTHCRADTSKWIAHSNYNLASVYPRYTEKQCTEETRENDK